MRYHISGNDLELMLLIQIFKKHARKIYQISHMYLR